jgi:hypothetical protein
MLMRACHLVGVNPDCLTVVVNFLVIIPLESKKVNYTYRLGPSSGRTELMTSIYRCSEICRKIYHPVLIRACVVLLSLSLSLSKPKFTNY